jgi:hypothetical protein
MLFSVQQQLVELDGFLVALRVSGTVGPADIDRIRRLSPWSHDLIATACFAQCFVGENSITA